MASGYKQAISPNSTLKDVFIVFRQMHNHLQSVILLSDVKLIKIIFLYIEHNPQIMM